MLNRGQDAALLVGRLFVAALFLPSGIAKLVAFSAFAASLAAKGLPYAKAWAALGVAAEVLGPLLLILGLWPRPAALALVALTALNVWAAHHAQLLGAVSRPQQHVDFYRSLAIMGGLLFYFASGPGAWSWRGGRGRASA